MALRPRTEYGSMPRLNDATFAPHDACHDVLENTMIIVVIYFNRPSWVGSHKRAHVHLSMCHLLLIHIQIVAVTKSSLNYQL